MTLSFFEQLEQDAAITAIELSSILEQEDNVSATSFDLNKTLTSFKSLLPLVTAAIRNANIRQSNFERDVTSATANYIRAAVTLTNVVVKDLVHAGVDINDNNNRWSVRKVFSICCEIVDAYLKQHTIIDQEELNRFGCIILSMATSQASYALCEDDERNAPFLNSICSILKNHPHIDEMMGSDSYFNFDNIEDQIAVAYSTAISKMHLSVIACSMGMDENEAVTWCADKIETSTVSIINGTIKNQDGIINESTYKMFIMSAIDKSTSILKSVWEQKHLQLVYEHGALLEGADFDQARNEISTRFSTSMGCYLAACEKGKIFVESLLSKNVLVPTARV